MIIQIEFTLLNVKLLRQQHNKYKVPLAGLSVFSLRPTNKCSLWLHSNTKLYFVV